MTYQPKAEFLRVMIARGYLQDCTDLEGLDKALTGGVVPAYIGFDCTAPSLHVGSLVQIMMLHWLQETGHQPIVLTHYARGWLLIPHPLPGDTPHGANRAYRCFRERRSSRRPVNGGSGVKR